MYFRTPERRRVMRWIERTIPVEDLLQVEALTRNALRVRKRDGGILAAICRQDGEIVLMDSPADSC